MQHRANRRLLFIRSIIAGILVTIAFGTAAQAQTCDRTTLLWVTDDFPVSNEYLGQCVVLHGAQAFIGQPYGNLGSVRPGAVLWYDQVNVAFPPEGPFQLMGDLDDAPSRFGHAIATNGSWLAVGAPDGHDTGVVYLYRWIDDDWQFHRLIQPQDPINESLFGAALAMHGDLLAIGIPEAEIPGGTRGRIEAHRLIDDDFVYEATLEFVPFTPQDRIGHSLAIGPDRILSGSYAFASAEGATGAVHEFVFDGGWNYAGPIANPINDTGSIRFGSATALDGDRLAVGAWDDDNGGSVYLFEWDGAAWQWTDHLLSGDEDALRFGTAVALDGDRLVVGDRYNMEAGTFAGAAYVYQLIEGTWWLERKLLYTGSGASHSSFGQSVDIAGSVVLVGAPEYGSTNYGMARAYRLGPDCNENGRCDEFDIALGYSTDLDGDGVPDDCEPDLDGDGIIDDADNCPLTPNPAQDDGDHDGVGDDCETCLVGQLVHGPAVADSPGKVIVANAETVLIMSGESSVWPDHVHAYRRDINGTPILEAELLAPDSIAGNDGYGFDLALDGTTAVVGCPQHDGSGTNAGAIYLFERTGETWSTGLRIDPPNPSNYDEFGYAVSLLGDWLAVGEPGKGADGVTHLYHRDPEGAWTPSTTLIPPGSANTDDFGECVVLDGERLVIGATGGQRAVFVYRLQLDGMTWALEGHLEAPFNESYFAEVLAVDGDLIATSARRDYGTSDPNVFVYRYDHTLSAWITDAEIHIPPASTDADVALEGDRLLIGYPARSLERGGGVVYRRDQKGGGWQYETEVTPAPAWEMTGLGVRVELFAGTAFLTSPFFDSPAAPNGGFVMIDLDHEPDCDGDGICDGLAIGWGIVGDCDQDQLPDNCEIDADGDGLPDDCDPCVLDVDPACPADLSGDGQIGFSDLVIILSEWGQCGGDLDNSGATDFGDVVLLLSIWGPCPE